MTMWNPWRGCKKNVAMGVYIAIFIKETLKEMLIQMTLYKQKIILNQ